MLFVNFVVAGAFDSCELRGNNARQVHAQDGFYTSDKFSLDSYENWELWDYDVVEAFLSISFRPVSFVRLQHIELVHIADKTLVC